MMKTREFGVSTRLALFCLLQSSSKVGTSPLLNGLKIMTELNRIKQLQARRLRGLFEVARQRYLDAGGDPQRTPSGRKGDDYMTDTERQEALELTRQIFDFDKIKDKAEVSSNPSTQ